MAPKFLTVVVTLDLTPITRRGIRPPQDETVPGAATPQRPVARPHDGENVARTLLAGSYQCANDGPHHLPTSTFARSRNARCRREIGPRRVSDASHGGGAPGPFRQNDEKSCSPTNGSAPSRRPHRTAGVPEPARNGRIRSVHDRVLIRAPLGRVPRRIPAGRRTGAHTISGRASH
jgi:hypothetical protein